MSITAAMPAIAGAMIPAVEGLLGGGGGLDFASMMQMSPEQLKALPPEALKSLMQFAQQNAMGDANAGRAREVADREIGMSGTGGGQGKDMSQSASGDLAKLMSMVGKRQQPNPQQRAPQQPPMNQYIQSLLGV